MAGTIRKSCINCEYRKDVECSKGFYCPYEKPDLAHQKKPEKKKLFGFFRKKERNLKFPHEVTKIE